MRVAFLGLGRMGRILADHVIDGGHSLTVWNRSPAAAAPFRDRGATVAGSPSEAVRGADVVVTVLFGPATVREVVVDAELAIPTSAVWLDITTVSPADADRFAAWAARMGVRYVHAPVIGSLAPARERSLGTAVGGAPDSIDVVMPLVGLWANPHRLQRYDSPGKAAAGKLVANLALAVSMQGLVEAVTLGNAGGLTIDETLATLDGTALGMVAGMKGQNVRSGEYGDTQFSTDLLAKDARLMVETSPRPLPELTLVLGALRRAQDAGSGKDDFSVIAREIG